MSSSTPSKSRTTQQVNLFEEPTMVDIVQDEDLHCTVLYRGLLQKVGKYEIAKRVRHGNVGGDLPPSYSLLPEIIDTFFFFYYFFFYCSYCCAASRVQFFYTNFSSLNCFNFCSNRVYTFLSKVKCEIER